MRRDELFCLDNDLVVRRLHCTLIIDFHQLQTMSDIVLLVLFLSGCHSANSKSLCFRFYFEIYSGFSSLSLADCDRMFEFANEPAPTMETLRAHTRNNAAIRDIEHYFWFAISKVLFLSDHLSAIICV